MQKAEPSDNSLGAQLRRPQVFGIILLAVIGLYVSLYWALGQGFWSRSPWDTYTLRALT